MGWRLKESYKKAREERMEAMRRKTFKILGRYEVNFTSDFVKYNEVRSVLERNEAFAQTVFREICWESPEFHSFDGVFSKMMPAAMHHIEGAAETGVELLMKHSVDYIDKDALLERVFEKCSFESAFAEIFAAREVVLEAMGEIQAETPSSRWVGGGFGFTGAIKGAIKASAMNLAADALSGFGKMITGNTKDARIRKIKEAVYEEINPVYVCIRGFHTVYENMIKCILEILIEEGQIPNVTIGDTKKVEGKYKNIVRRYESGSCSKDEAITNLCQCIEMHPYHYWWPAYIYKIDKRSKNDILKLGEYLGLVTKYKTLGNWIEIIDKDPDRIPGFN